MRLLLDTNAFLWFIAGDERLSEPAREAIADVGNEVLLSVASLWEIAIKLGLGKLELQGRFHELIPQQLADNELGVLPIELRHLVVLTELPSHHRDPFDRLIISQGIAENIPILSVDGVFREYPVRIIW
jgi:PIN domain nuclease of toxin-antitoxin system